MKRRKLVRARARAWRKGREKLEKPAEIRGEPEEHQRSIGVRASAEAAGWTNARRPSARRGVGSRDSTGVRSGS